MLGTLINAAMIVAGSFLGLLLGPRLPEGMKKALMMGMGLCTLVIGIQDAIGTSSVILVIAAVVIGSAAGSLLKLEERLNRLGGRLQRAASKNAGSLGEGFVNASLIFCVGAMAVTGSLQSGLKGDHSTLIAKGILDGVMSVILAGTMGPGVMLSALAVLVYQGTISLLAGALESLLSDARVVTEMTAVGGVLIMGIGFNLLGRDGEHRIPVGDMLPAVFCPLFLTLIM